MTDLRLQREHEHSLSAAVRSWFSTEAGKVNTRYRAIREARLLEHNKAFDQVRDELTEARHTQPRDNDCIEALQARLRELKARPLPDFSELEAERLTAVNALDQVVAGALRDIRHRAMRGLLDTRLEWDETGQCFYVPQHEHSEAAHA